MPQMGFYFDQTRCTGCFTCAVACKDWHDIPAGPVHWLRVRAIEKGRFPNPFLAYLAVMCFHCVDAPCILACPVRAITKRQEDGLVVVDRDRCLGKEECGARCLKACPWEVPQFGPEPDARMEKCDFCLDRLEAGQQTICVEACPMYALDAGTIVELRGKYGSNVKAAGFKYSERAEPSIVFRGKAEPEAL